MQGFFNMCKLINFNELKSKNDTMTSLHVEKISDKIQF